MYRVQACLHVFPVGDKWAVAFNGNPPHHIHDDYSTALQVARDAAFGRWQVFGMPCRVVVRDADEKMFDDLYYGPDQPANEDSATDGPVVTG